MQDSLTVYPFTTDRPDVIKKVQIGVVANHRSQSLKFILTLPLSVMLIISYTNDLSIYAN